jgi:hypothetical protein
MFERQDQKLIVFVFLGRFRESVHLREECPKTRCFYAFGHLHELLPKVLGFWGDLQGP